MKLASNISCCLLVAWLPSVLVAQNLVPNASFELYDSCPCTIGFQDGGRPLYWGKWDASPDYFNACVDSTCFIDTLIDVPRNGWTYQDASDGNAYVGVYAFDGVPDEYREYVGAELLEPLTVGCSYHVRFRANPAYDGTYWLPNGGGACNNIGLLFTMASNEWNGLTGPSFALRDYAHVYSPFVIDDTLAWTLVEGTFVADSAYSYVVLGNFFSDAWTIGYPNAGSLTDVTYFLLDDVLVEPVDSGCHGTGVGESTGSKDPHLRWIDQSILVNWNTDGYQGCILDALGRTVTSWRESIGGALTLANPHASGAYLVTLRRAGVIVSYKFIVLDR